MTNYLFKCLQSGNQFKLLIAFWLCSLFFVAINAQYLTVSGVMSDEPELPIPGASIRIESALTGATTDLDDNKTLLDVASNAVLEFCYLGLISQDISVKGRFVTGVATKFSAT